jgi:hypothetical protein
VAARRKGRESSGKKNIFLGRRSIAAALEEFEHSQTLGNGEVCARPRAPV